MSEIAKLKQIEPHVSAEAIEALEQLVARAKTGEIKSFVCILTLVPNGWCEVSSGCSDLLQTLGIINLAAAQTTERLMGR